MVASPMAILSAFRGLSNYTPAESLFYDSIVERAIAPLHRRVLGEIEGELGPKRPRILDVGCGGGHFAMALAERAPGAEIVGLDLSPEQIARARRRAAGFDQLRFVEGSALDLPFEDRRFDLVLSLGSLKHWPSAQRGLEECARVLAPGGRLWVIEGDRGCRPADVQAFIDAWRIPAALKPVMRLFFHNALVPQCLDLVDARSIVADLRGVEAEVRRFEGLPMMVIEGRAPGAADEAGVS